MNESDVLEAPQLEPPKSGFDERWRREYVVFTRLLPELLKTHRDKFVAIHGGAVVAVGDAFVETALKAYERVGYIPMHVGHVTENPLPSARVPSPRLVRPTVLL